MGIFANLPIGLAPGLGLNAYVSGFVFSSYLLLFAWSSCVSAESSRTLLWGFHGAGRLTYQEALAAVFLEGWVFFLLSIFGIRQWLARAMPNSLVMAVGAGIGILSRVRRRILFETTRF